VQPRCAWLRARSHKDLICWQRAYELKLKVYELFRSGTVTHDFDFRDQLKESASSAPRLIAEGFGRYYPAEFSKYFRLANGSSKAASRLIAYLATTDIPREPPSPRKRRAVNPRRTPKNQ
jgi:four helix bundle protein